MGKIFILGAMGAFLAGCASTSGVMDAGGGHFLITAQASPLRGGSEGVALDTANAHCRSLGRSHAVAEGLGRPVMGNKVDLHFHCE